MLPSSVEVIDLMAFGNCENLTSVSLSNSLSVIGTKAFYDCISLASINIPNSVNQIGVMAFEGCINMSSVTLSNSIMEICPYSFQGCNRLLSIIIPNSVKEIGAYSFSECSSLSSIIIPDSVEKIRDYAFYRCSQLSTITIGHSTDTIGNYAFSGIPHPDSIVMKPLNPPSITFYTFHEMSTNVPVIVPCGSKQNYNNAYYWNTFTQVEEDCNEDIEDVDHFNEISIFSQGRHIIVDNIDAMNVDVFDMMGRSIYHGKSSAIFVGQIGVYLVKVGTRPAKKVFVL